MPGAEDPALRVAAHAWLDSEEPQAHLREIGTLAVLGNPAARHLANSIYRNYLPALLPNLSREEQRALFPADPEPPRFPSRVYDTGGDPAREAGTRLSVATTFDAWRREADALLSAGFRGYVLGDFAMLYNRQPDFLSEATVYVEHLLPEGAWEWQIVWWQRFNDQVQIETALTDAPERRQEILANWGGPPWDEAQERQFTAAVADGRWAAIIALAGFGIPKGETLTFPFVDIRGYEREVGWARLILDSKSRDPDTPVPNDATLQELGRHLMTEADRSTYLAPLRTACETLCSGTDLPLCMATGTLASLYSFAPTAALEPVLTEEDMRASKKAAIALLPPAGRWLSQGLPPQEWARPPACFRDRAIAAYDESR